MEDNRHPMEETEDSAGIRESFEKENTDEWTKGRQKNKIRAKAETESPPYNQRLTLHGGA